MTIISLLLLASLLPHLTFTVNSTEAKQHSRHYTVCLQKSRRHVCGGFLISDRFVMTAALCRMKNETLTAVVGAHDLTKNEESFCIEVKSYYKHPDFKRCTMQNDIMLLRKEVKPNEIVKIISIPTQEGDIKADSVCSVLKGENATCLMEADVKIMNNTECKKKWKNKISASQMMCVYGHGGSCSGDSGGLLVCGDTSVASFGDPEVCNSLEWICSIIANVK